MIHSPYERTLHCTCVGKAASGVEGTLFLLGTEDSCCLSLKGLSLQAQISELLHVIDNHRNVFKKGKVYTEEL